MFTGLVEEVGKIRSLSNNILSIGCKKILNDSQIGDSIAVNGVCLTVTEKTSAYLSFHISPTTAAHSRFKAGEIKNNEDVNLERALKPTERLGGHVVSGHIDCSTKIISIKKRSEDTYFEFLYPKDLRYYIVPKGSIAVDGISLTINEVLSSSFIVTVIPHTLLSTNLGQKKINDSVHIEIDTFARYVHNILKTGGFRWNQ